MICKLRKIIIGLAVLILVLLAGTHIVLERHCTALVHSQVLPWLHQRYRADIKLENISINLLTGTLLVQGMTIGNPPGFEEMEMVSLPRFRLRLAMLDLLFRNTVIVRSLRVSDAEVRVVRNRAGQFNLHGFTPETSDPAGDDVRPAQPDETVARPAPAPDAAPAEPATVEKRSAPRRLAVDKARIRSHVHYIDYNPIFQPDPLYLELDLNIFISHVANFGRADVLSGGLVVDGDIVVNDHRTSLEMRGRIAPVIDPGQLTFELTGSTKTFLLTDAPPLAAWLGLESGKVACAIALSAHRNVYDPGKSILRFEFSEIRPTPAARQRFKGITLPTNFTLALPVSGDLENPKVDFNVAIARLLTSDDFLGSILQGIRPDR